MPSGSTLFGIGVTIIVIGIAFILSSQVIPDPPQKEHKSFTASTQSGYLIPIDAKVDDKLNFKVYTIGSKGEIFFTIFKPDGNEISTQFSNIKITNGYSNSVIIPETGTYILAFDNKHSVTVPKGIALTIELSNDASSTSVIKPAVTPLGAFLFGNGIIFTVVGLRSRKPYSLKWEPE